MSPSPELIWEGKYDKAGKKVAPVRVALPFQTVETINESSSERQRSLDLFTSGRDGEWRNRLIWGDKKYVLPALLPEFQGKVALIYIDPPFDTGADFSMRVRVGDDGDGFTKVPSVIEQKAYRDTWGAGLDSYLRWFHDTAALLHELLTENGSLYVHLDWHVGHYAKAILDELFGQDAFRNEIVWWYYNKLQGNVNHFAMNHDVIFYYAKGKSPVFNRIQEKRDAPMRQQKRAWDPATKSLKQARDAEGKLEYYTVTERLVDDVWRLPYLMPADETENLRYPTQKPRALIERIIRASSNEGDLVLDCFAGSGTAAEAAERLNRRWIAADLGRFAIHTTRKRMLSTPGVKPFVIQNLGKYERQHWQAAEFRGDQDARQQRYRDFILKMYGATSVQGYSWLHGIRAGRMVHVGAVDAPVSPGDVTQMVTELRRVSGAEAKTKAIDVLGWDFAFELNEVAKQQSSAANISLRFFKIPLDVMDPRAVEQGDVKFFELAALAVTCTKKGREAAIALTDFVIPADDVPADVQKTIKDWSQWIDYWAIDWDNRTDTFHNEWQTYRTKDKPKLERSANHSYEAAGRYRVVVKVIDILGNDTTKILDLEVK